MVLPREAITVGSDGVQTVWEQSQPEMFVPHPVRVEDLDGAHVLVTDGLQDGARVAIGGVRLLAQLR
jgi:hypothetical protein